MRTVKNVIHSAKVLMGDVFLDQPLPHGGLDQVDPFLLIHHWNNYFYGNQSQKEVGVGPHPHRGFTPVTMVFKGAVHHRDSRGGDSIVGEGGVQWMDSGMGIIHSERPVSSLAMHGGDFEIVQIWINNPSNKKLGQPLYTPLLKEDIPSFMTDDNKSEVFVVAGEINGVKGRITGHTPILMLRIDVKKDSEFTLDIPQEYNVLVYQLDGRLEINDSESGAKYMTVLDHDDSAIRIKGIQDTRAILLAGKPIGEKVASRGPFVMNSESELLVAMRDYQNGKMGMLIEEFEPEADR